MTQRKSRHAPQGDEEFSAHLQTYVTPTMARQLEDVMKELSTEHGGPVTMAAVVRMALAQFLKGRVSK